jgi:hypothetical protein
MKKILLLSLLALIVFSSCRQLFGKRIRGNGVIKTETRAVTGYNSVDVSGAMDVYIKQDSVQSIKIETDENLLEYITVREEGGVLKIYPKDNSNLKPSGSIKVYVAGPDFRRLEASGACDYYTENKISNAESIAIDLSGSCDANLELNAPRITAEVTGAGKLTLKGEAKELEVEGTGSSHFKCMEMMAEDVKVNITGSGDAEVFASVKLDVKVSGSGSVRYKGNASVSQKVAGSGSVKKVDTP